MRILIVHGPNLNLLGKREIGFYGHFTLEELNQSITNCAIDLGVTIDFIQSNSEQSLVESIQNAHEMYKGIVINPAGYGYTSIALKDAIIASTIPVVEVHLSNIHARDCFRRTTVISDVCIGQIAGFKAMSYVLGLIALVDHLKHVS